MANQLTSWRTRPIVVWSRTLGRRLGFTRWLSSVLGGAAPEQRFAERLLGQIHTGDCVWDIGANVGDYTRQFARSVGDTGMVYAFEPHPATYSLLAERCSALVNVTPMAVALGACDASLQLIAGQDALAATSRLTDTSSAGITVAVRSVLSLLHGDQLRPANIMKIDVEGHELEVLTGMAAALNDDSLRALGVEVHFGQLHARGVPAAPAHIERLLRAAQFCIKWTDSSHLVATR
jgi:FkbM family methyltransferase